jgi:hypothetical protein
MSMHQSISVIRCAAMALAVSLGTGASAEGVKAEIITPDPIAAQVAHGGKARVIVLLNTPFVPEGTLSPAAAAQQRAAIAAAQDAFVAEVVKGSASQVLNRFSWTPSLVLEIDAPTLERIRRSKRVKAVEADQLMQPMAPAALPASPQ